MFRLRSIESNLVVESFERALRAPLPGSEDEKKQFYLLSKQLKDQVRYVFPDPRTPRSVVIVPSLSMDEVVLTKIDGVQYYEERMLCLLALLRLPQTNLIYVTSSPIPRPIIDYYLHLLPGIPVDHARKRLTLLTCYDGSSVPLSLKILERPRLVRKIRNALVDPQLAHMTCFNTTSLERTLAVRLDIPLYGCDPDLKFWGSKSGSREIFKEIGLDVPPGFENLRSTSELIDALDELKGGYPRLKRAVIKLDEGASGEGNVIFSFEGVPNGASRKPWLSSNLHRQVTLESKGQTWSQYKASFNKMGGVVESFIDEPNKRSPSMQGRVDPLGNVSIVSTHDQVLGGLNEQVFLGGLFPADREYRLAIQDAGLKVGHALQKKGIIGRYGTDFISIKRGKKWKHLALENNIRKGGTTHPYLMLQLLTDGYYNPEDGLYTTRSGLKRYYFASDNVCSPSLRGFTPEDLTDIFVDHGLHFHAATQTGVVFHLIGALSEFGKLGVTCISDSQRNALKLYDKIIRVLEMEGSEQTRARQFLGA